MRDGQKRKSERKFYPGYVLVQMEMDETTWHLVRDVPKVLGFIGGTSDKPAPISEREANQILRRVEEGVDKPRPKVLFQPGQVVRVTHGPFNDFNGVVENVNYEKRRLQVVCRFSGVRRRWSWTVSQLRRLKNYDPDGVVIARDRNDVRPGREALTRGASARGRLDQE